MCEVRIPAVLVILLFSVALCGACDKKAPETPPVDDPSPGNVITGAERLEWDQQAFDFAELATIHYAIYVDGQRSELDASCADTPTAAGFACSAKLPLLTRGAHTLEIASFIVDETTFESPRSSPLQVVVGSASSAAPQASWGSTVTTTDGLRLRPELVADGLNRPTDMAFAPDGRLFLAEQAGSVRIVRGDRLAAEPAVILDDVALNGYGGLLAIALDPDFERHPFVYALYTAISRSDRQVFRVVRLREAGDTLGDQIVLLDDVAASPVRASASMRFGPDRQLYVTFDNGGDRRLAGDFAALNGKVLRLNADGTTPDDQPGRNPMYSYGFDAPDAFDWQSVDRLWIADNRGAATELRLVVPSRFFSGRGAITTTYDLSPLTLASSMVFYRGARLPGFEGNLLMVGAETSFLIRFRFDQNDPTRIEAGELLLENMFGTLRTVGVGRDGAIYFTNTHSLGRLVPAEPQ
jgi:glucose/arabinose dehydrogenase